MGKLTCVGKCHQRIQTEQTHMSLLKEGWIFVGFIFFFQLLLLQSKSDTNLEGEV